jgi:hypothetical protein
MMPARRKRARMQAAKPDAPIRCPSFLQHIRGYNCACVENDPTGCGGKIQAAHVRRGSDGGVGMKPGDNFAIPLCEWHHHEQHSIGEQSFEMRHRFKMLQVADRLWRRWITTTEAGRKFAEQLRGVSPAEGPTPTNPPEPT